jgi:hypothetical protein
MYETKVSRRPRGEDAIYFATAKNRYVGSVSLGYGPDGKRIRRKVLGKTKQEVRDRLKALRDELNAGVRSSSTYTVRDASTTAFARGLMARLSGRAPFMRACWSRCLRSSAPSRCGP